MQNIQVICFDAIAFGYHGQCSVKDATEYRNEIS